MNNQERDKLVKVFQKAKEILSGPDRVVLSHMHLAEDKDGKEVSIYAPTAERFCLLGTLCKATIELNTPIYIGDKYIKQAVKICHKRRQLTLGTFKRGFSTTRDAKPSHTIWMQEILDKAIELVQMEK